MSVIAGLAFGLAPALQRPSSILGLRGFQRSREYLRRGLIVSQIASSMVLISGAGLLVRTLWNAQLVGVGVRAANVYSARIVLGQQRYGQLASQAAFFRQLHDRFAQTPGVESFMISDSAPPDIPSRSNPFSAWRVAGHDAFSGGTGGKVVWRAVDGDYFGVLGIPLLKGHDFRDTEVRDGARPIILSQEFARRLFGNEDPLTRQIQFGGGTTPLTTFVVAGVAAEARNRPVTEANDPEYYVPADLSGLQPQPGQIFSMLGRSAVLTIKSSIPERDAANRIASQIAEIDPAIPVKVTSLAERVDRLTVRQRFNASVLGIFAVLGLFLAAVGLYGVVSFLVTQRTQEIGVRMAIGATQADVLRLVMSGALKRTGAGVLLGLAGGAAGTRFLEGLLFGVKRGDFWSLATAVAILLAAAVLSAWLPAHRASRIDPVEALRV